MGCAVVKQGVIPMAFLQKYINKWVSTGLDLFEPMRARPHSGHVYGVKGRYDEREAEVPADREHLNEESRMHYFNEIKAEMVRISKPRKEENPIVHPQRQIQPWSRKLSWSALGCSRKPFEGSDADWQAYLDSVLPTDEDERILREEYLTQEWIQYREWKGN